jgi:hypothetical protein
VSADSDDDGAGSEGQVRLQKYLAQSGVASRRKCEELMLAGLVEVDGEVVTRLGTRIDPRTAVVRVDGKRLPPISPNVYLVLNKPRGVVSTMSDPEGRRTLQDLVADRPERLFHVGRLDTDTSGQSRGRRRGHEGHPEAPAGGGDARGRCGHRHPGPGRQPRQGQDDRRAGHP